MADQNKISLIIQPSVTMYNIKSFQVTITSVFYCTHPRKLQHQYPWLEDSGSVVYELHKIQSTNFLRLIEGEVNGIISFVKYENIFQKTENVTKYICVTYKALLANQCVLFLFSVQELPFNAFSKWLLRISDVKQLIA